MYREAKIKEKRTKNVNYVKRSRMTVSGGGTE